MASYGWLLWLHLVAVSTWTGGLIVLWFSVASLRRAGANRDMLRAVARQFARVSWTAMLLAIATGLAQVQILRLPFSHRPLLIKLLLVGVLIVVAVAHQLSARRSSPAVRGAVQLVIMLCTLAVVRAAIDII